jgi:hypothetical protein
MRVSAALGAVNSRGGSCVQICAADVTSISSRWNGKGNRLHWGHSVTDHRKCAADTHPSCQPKRYGRCSTGRNPDCLDTVVPGFALFLHQRNPDFRRPGALLPPISIRIPAPAGTAEVASRSGHWREKPARRHRRDRPARTECFNAADGREHRRRRRFVGPQKISGTAGRKSASIAA